MCASQIPGSPLTMSLESLAGGRSIEENAKESLGAGKLYTFLNPEFPDPVAPHGPARQPASPTSRTGGGLRKKKAGSRKAPEVTDGSTDRFSGLQLL